LLASLLENLENLDTPPRVETCLLLAPACTHETFNRSYRPLLKERRSRKYGIGPMAIYNLDQRRELDDTVTPLYRKSLLYLVSNAFEERKGERILGMQKFRSYLGNVPRRPVFQIHSSDGTSNNSSKTASKKHGGFDNDVDTMNDVLSSILRGAPEREFTRQDLKY
jgi:hypothetical protein